MSVYFIRAGGAGPIKIGHSLDPFRRLYNLQCAHHEPLAVVAIAPGGHVEERKFHARFAGLRIKGEWFRCAGELAAWVKENGGLYLRPVSPKAKRQLMDGLRDTLGAAGIRPASVADTLGVSVSTVSRYLHGKLPLTVDALLAIRGLVQARTERLWSLDAVLGLPEDPPVAAAAPAPVSVAGEAQP